MSDFTVEDVLKILKVKPEDKEIFTFETSPISRNGIVFSSKCLKTIKENISNKEYFITRKSSKPGSCHAVIIQDIIGYIVQYESLDPFKKVLKLKSCIFNPHIIKQIKDGDELILYPRGIGEVGKTNRNILVSIQLLSFDLYHKTEIKFTPKELRVE